MKKIILLSCLLLSGTTAFCNEIVSQEQTASDIKGAIVIKKQPTQESAKQVQHVEKVYGSIVIFVQGKVPFDKSESKN